MKSLPEYRWELVTPVDVIQLQHSQMGKRSKEQGQRWCFLDPYPPLNGKFLDKGSKVWGASNCRIEVVTHYVAATEVDLMKEVVATVQKPRAADQGRTLEAIWILS
jgi:hypothetical protein